jgi:hypothetical protein
MSYDRSKFVEVDGYLILRSTIAEQSDAGVRLHDGRFFGYRS